MSLGRFITSGNKTFIHGEKYRVVAGLYQGQVVRCVDRNFDIPPNVTDVGVKLQDGTNTYINPWHLDNFFPGSIEYTEPIRKGFPF